jgi:uncharacterized protein
LPSPLKPKEIIVSKQKSVVERYIEGFRRSDHAQILSCLADDIVWDLYGYKTIKEDFEGRPSLTINRLIEEGNTVVAIGSGSVSKRDGNLMKFVFSEVFTFAGDLVSHLETYHIWLN